MHRKRKQNVWSDLTRSAPRSFRLNLREIDCKTTNGVIVLLNKNTNLKTICGRLLISTTSFDNLTLDNKEANYILSEQYLNQLKK